MRIWGSVAYRRRGQLVHTRLAALAFALSKSLVGGLLFAQSTASFPEAAPSGAPASAPTGALPAQPAPTSPPVASPPPPTASAPAAVAAPSVEPLADTATEPAVTPRSSAAAKPPPPFLPPVLPYRPGLQVPDQYRLETKANRGLALGGASVFGASYAAGIIFAAGANFQNATEWLLLPVGGPYLAIINRDFSCNRTDPRNTNCYELASSEVETITFLALDGLIEAVGATLFIVGIVDKQQALVRRDVAQVGFVGRVGPRGGVLGVHGRF